MYELAAHFLCDACAYGLIMATGPQTLYGLADSPIDLAAFMLHHGDGPGQPGLVQQVLEGRLQKPSDLTRDHITLYWLTNSGISSARLYRVFKGGYFTAKSVTIPFCVSTFADKLYRVPRSLAEQAYPTSSPTTSTTGAVTSPPGNSRSCSQKTSARRSGH
jgi:hypothetical protein